VANVKIFDASFQDVGTPIIAATYGRRLVRGQFQNTTNATATFYVKALSGQWRVYDLSLTLQTGAPMSTSEQVEYYHTDAMGSVRLVTIRTKRVCCK
jgi:hypothetical protein